MSWKESSFTYLSAPHHEYLLTLHLCVCWGKEDCVGYIPLRFYSSNTLSLWTVLVWLKLTTVPFCEEESRLQGQQLHGLDLASETQFILLHEGEREEERSCCPLTKIAELPISQLYIRTRMYLRHTLVVTTWNACTLVEAAGGN